MSTPYGLYAGGPGASPWSMGLKIMTARPDYCTSNAEIPALLMFLNLATATATGPVSVLGAWLQTAGVTTGTGVDQMALYSATGILLAHTGDMTTAMESTGFAEGALTAEYTVTAGVNYYLAFLDNFTGTAPVLAAVAPLDNIPALNGNYMSLFDGGPAALPSSFTPSALSITQATVCMYAR